MLWIGLATLNHENLICESEARKTLVRKVLQQIRSVFALNGCTILNLTSLVFATVTQLIVWLVLKQQLRVDF